MLGITVYMVIRPPKIAAVAHPLWLCVSRLSSWGCRISGSRGVRVSVSRVVVLLLLTSRVMYNDRKHC